MLDFGSSHSTTKSPCTPCTPRNAGKRIPASLMKMRRESLAQNKYKLPTLKLDANDNSLAGMTAKLGAGVQSHIGELPAKLNSEAQSHIGELPAFCTPKRQAPRTFQINMENAKGLLGVGDLLKDAVVSKRSSDVGIKVAALRRTLSKSSDAMESKGGKGALRRSLSIGGELNNDFNTRGDLTSKDMDALLRSGLATPRRTRRSVVRLPAALDPKQQRVSRLKSKTTDCLGGSNHSNRGSNHSGGIPKSPRQRSNPRRTKSSDDVNVLCTPRRTARKPAVRRVPSNKSTSSKKDVEQPDEDPTAKPAVRRVHSNKSTSSKKDVEQQPDEDPTASASSFSSDNVGEMTTPVATIWKCHCGEENPKECGFCGMCGSGQRWECADCSYANKCKFKFCGMCGIAKTVKGEES